MARTGKSNIRNHHLSNLNKRNPAQAKRTIERGTRREGDKECAEGEKEHNETSDDGPQEEETQEEETQEARPNRCIEGIGLCDAPQWVAGVCYNCGGTDGQGGGTDTSGWGHRW